MMLDAKLARAGGTMPKQRIGRRQFLSQAAGTTAGLTAMSHASPAPSPPSPLPQGERGEAEAALPGGSLDELSQAVRGTIASQRIGRPVFVRCTAQGPEQGNALIGRLARLAELAGEWIGQPMVRIAAVGSAESGQAALALDFKDGATALVSYAKGTARGAGVDVLVIGNRGSITFDAGSAPTWDCPPAWGEKRAEAQLLAAVEKALTTGKPLSLE